MYIGPLLLSFYRDVVTRGLLLLPVRKRIDRKKREEDKEERKF